jgi:3'-phosphoadenosine 5'-phosphosulfate sulfotransferase (PAPS reductase)/FAD synthetase
MQGTKPRVVSWFSCGAASAVATKMVLDRREPGQEIVIAYCDTLKREHPDNRRLIADCEKWFGQEIVIVGNDDYERDTDQVFRKTRYLVGPRGARCTGELKKKVRWGFARPTDIVVIGFTKEEEKRVKQLSKSEPMTRFLFPLLDAGVSKDDCYAALGAAGIELPAMYRLGYRNNNCIGCVKGQAGYWNKIRVDFPERFAEMAAIERELNRTICKREWIEDGVRKRERIYLDEMPSDLGNYGAEPNISCGVLCSKNEGVFA